MRLPILQHHRMCGCVCAAAFAGDVVVAVVVVVVVVGGVGGGGGGGGCVAVVVAAGVVAVGVAGGVAVGAVVAVVVVVVVDVVVVVVVLDGATWAGFISHSLDSASYIGILYGTTIMEIFEILAKGDHVNISQTIDAQTVVVHDLICTHDSKWFEQNFVICYCSASASMSL